MTTAVVLLLQCPGCYAEWLAIGAGQDAPACPWCWRVTLQVRTAWTAQAAPWWEMLSDRAVAVESARHFLWHLRWCIMREHPSGPLGSHVTTPGMQLTPATMPNGDTTWRFTRCAGSDN